MINSHYVPMLTLRRFGEKLSVFNVRTGEFFENKKIKKLFSKKGMYTEEVENKLNEKIESQFGNLLANKIMICDKKIELSRDELRIIKKFLLVSVIRSLGSDEFMIKEKQFYKMLEEEYIKYAKNIGISKEEAIKDAPKAPFIEKEKDNETLFDYWMRTLNVILDSDGTPDDILKQPDKTYPAHRWAEVINNGYLAFWDSNFEQDEFIITDIGMTSENEKGWNGITVQNQTKIKFMIDLLKNENDSIYKKNICHFLKLQSNFSENFMMFPISAKRMIVQICPFFKFRILYKDKYKMLPLSVLTKIPNEKLFYPNMNEYVLPQKNLELNPHKDDKYIYKINKLTSEETRYCNALFLDRIDTHVGFSSLKKVAGSIIMYKNLNSLPYVPRVDYTELYELINKRHYGNIDLTTIKKLRKK